MADFSVEQRLCLHLTTLDAADTMGYAATAPGIAEALGLGATALSGRFELFSALSALQDRGFLEEETAVVDTLDGEQRIYRLTAEGRTHARNIAQRLADREVTLRTRDGEQTLELRRAANRLDCSVAQAATKLQAGVLVPEDDIEQPTVPDALSFVDRTDALEWLDTRYERSLDGDAVIALVSGEQGVGKTRLVTEFGDRVRDRGGLFLDGHCQSTVETPYQPVMRAIESLPADARTAIEEILHDQSGSADDDELLQQRRALFSRAAEELAAVTANQPVVLCLDDIQWCDRPTALLVAHLATSLRDEPFLTVLPTQSGGGLNDGELAEAFDEYRVSRDQFALDPFDKETTQELVCQLVGTRQVPTTFVDVVYRHTGGNPLFVTESVNRLLEDGIVQPTLQEYPETTDELSLSDTVEQSLTSRLDRLDGRSKELVELTSLAGGVVPEQVLASASNLDATAFRERVEMLVESNLWERADEGRIQFASGVVGETVREQLPDDCRGTYHHRLAWSYEEATTDPQQWSASVAHHYHQAGDLENAIDASLTAARRAMELYAHEVAIDATERALELARERGDDAAINEALERLGDAYRALGEYEEASRCFRYLRERAESDATTQRMYRKEGTVARQQGAFETARERLSGSLDSTARGTSEAAHTRYELGIVARKAGDYEQARTHLQGSLDRYRELADSGGEADCLMELGIVAWKRGDYDTAGDVYQESLDIYRDLEDRDGEARCLNNLGMARWQRDEYATAREYHEQSLEITRETGDRHYEAKVLNNLGIVEQKASHLEQAREYHERGLDIFRELGDRHSEAKSLGNLGLVARHQGNFEQAHEYHEEALRIFQELGDRHSEAMSLDNLGLVEQQEGHLEQARIYHGRSLDIKRELDDRLGQARTLKSLGRLAHLEGDSGTARQRLQRSLDLSRDLDATQLEATATNYLGLVARQTGNPELAREYHQESLDRFRNRDDSEAVGASLGYLGVVELRQGNTQAGRELLAEALSELQGVDAPPVTLEILRQHIEVELELGNDDRASDLCHQAQTCIEGTTSHLGYEQERVRVLCDCATDDADSSTVTADQQRTR